MADRYPFVRRTGGCDAQVHSVAQSALMMLRVSHSLSVSELALYFLRLGIIGFGGPPAHIALMRTDLVEKRCWLTSEQFATDLTTANLLPGPTSTEMAIYIGYRMRGPLGALISGWCFILPAALLVGLLAWAYVTWGGLSWMQHLLYGVKPVAFALVLHGLLQMVRTTPWTPPHAVILLTAFALLQWTAIDVLLIFLLAGMAALPSLRKTTPATLFISATTITSTSIVAAPLLSVLWEFLKIGTVIYSGGFALIGVLQQTIVIRLGWLTQQQLLDAIAVGQSTPGPVFTTATFIGYLVGGASGAALATIGIFAPAFVFVLAENLLLSRLKQAPQMRRFLQGVNIAVIASLVHAAIALGSSALIDPIALLLCAAAFGALWWKKIDAHWLVGVGVLVGLSRLAIF